jgi:hypothetical protein
MSNVVKQRHVLSEKKSDIVSFIVSQRTPSDRPISSAPVHSRPCRFSLGIKTEKNLTSPRQNPRPFSGRRVGEIERQLHQLYSQEQTNFSLASSVSGNGERKLLSRFTCTNATTLLISYRGWRLSRIITQLAASGSCLPLYKVNGNAFLNSSLEPP